MTTRLKAFLCFLIFSSGCAYCIRHAVERSGSGPHWDIFVSILTGCLAFGFGMWALLDWVGDDPKDRSCCCRY